VTLITLNAESDRTVRLQRDLLTLRDNLLKANAR